MINFSFTVAPSLKSELVKIDDTRGKILQELISRQEELELRFEANIDRVTNASRIGDKKLLRQEVASIVNPFDKKNQSQDSDIRAYMKAYSWIDQNWYMNSDKVLASDIRKVYSFFPKKVLLEDADSKQILDFTQVNPEHPIVQAGLVFILFSQVLPGDDRNIKLSLLASNIFLYKNGYDFRGLLNLEEFFASDVAHFRELLHSAGASRNLSSYLEYFTQAVGISSEHALQKIASRKPKHDLPKEYYELTERQKEILTLLAKPDVKISNKTVQKEFKISQITASRDLAKLHTLGLIFSAGKGRSVYYTKL